jgi:hypothetical protein
MVPGISMNLGGEDRIIAPLSFAAVRRLLPRLQTLRMDGPGAFSDEQIAVIVEAVGCSLRRNHPEVTDEQVLEWLDLGNFKSVFNAVMGASGLEKRPADAGNAGA